MPLFDATLSILEQSLNVRLDRQNLLASNLANANTPGYEAKDLDFASAMHSAAQELETAAAQSQARSFASQASASSSAGEPGIALTSADAPPFSLSLPAPSLPSVAPVISAGGALGLDHNRVDTDHAMVDLAANAINYGASAKAVAKKMAILSYVANDGQG
jgi:flagellar basal-body rod protein FlgB